MFNAIKVALVLTFALILAGCSHVITLYPRGGGERATGTVNDGSRKMTVTLKGMTYTGEMIRAQTVGIGIGQSYGATPSTGTTVFTGGSNQYSALLVSTDGTSVLRCDFTLSVAIGGNGICLDKDSVTYDMNIKAK